MQPNHKRKITFNFRKVVTDPNGDYHPDMCDNCKTEVDMMYDQEPAVKYVPEKPLSHKVIISISIRLNQAVRGDRDRQGNAVTQTNLLWCVPAHC